MLRNLASAVLFWQMLGLLFCGDIECLQGESGEICQTPLCSLFDNHDDSQLPFDLCQEDSCQCACNRSYNIPEIRPFSDTFVDSYFFVESRLFLSTPASRIDHIPRA